MTRWTVAAQSDQFLGQRFDRGQPLVLSPPGKNSV